MTTTLHPRHPPSSRPHRREQMVLGTGGLRKVMTQYVQELEREIALHCSVNKCVASTHKFVPEQTVTVYAMEDIILSRMSSLNCP